MRWKYIENFLNRAVDNRTQMLNLLDFAESKRTIFQQIRFWGSFLLPSFSLWLQEADIPTKPFRGHRHPEASHRVALASLPGPFSGVLLRPRRFCQRGPGIRPIDEWEAFIYVVAFSIDETSKARPLCPILSELLIRCKELDFFKLHYLMS